MTYTGSRGWNFAKSLRIVSICSSIDNRLLDRLCEEWISPSIDRSTSHWMMIGNGHKFVKTGFWAIGKVIDSWTINQTIDAIRYFECLDHHWPFFDYCRPFYHSLSSSPHWNDPLLKKSRRNLSSFIGVFKILKIEGFHHLAGFRLRQSPPPSKDDHRAFIFICNIDNHRLRLFPDAKDQFSPSAFSHLFFPYFQNGFQIWVCIFKLKFEFYFWKPNHCEEDCAVFQLVLIKLSKEIISIRMDIKCCLSCSCMEFIWLMKILHTSLKVVCLHQLCTL